MKPTIYLGLTLLALGALTACDDDYDTPSPIVTEPQGPVSQLVTGSGDIAASVAQFRTLLGEPRNGGAVGPVATGRREVTWDGVLAEFNNGDNKFPAAFFNTNVKLGLVVSTTTGTGFRNDSSLFGDIDATFKNEFSAFSPNKLFTVSNSNVLDVQFQLAGQPTAALVAGFGAVFVDVDLPNLSTLEFFDINNKLLRKVTVPVRTTTSAFSFAGARFESAIVARVRITLGSGAIGNGLKDLSAGGNRDIVVLDDFLYAEPQPQR
ncbi:MAG: hypothetical protein H7Z40_20090 [Phycisphaerae bacterium]|nr:hypothetical protein [Gemmatimonadaceae bacterium]